MLFIHYFTIHARLTFGVLGSEGKKESRDSVSALQEQDFGWNFI